MATFREILTGFYRGLWDFCFPLVKQRKRQRQLEYVVHKERLEWSAYHCTDVGVTDTSCTDTPVVVSLTSHGKRVLTVHRVIESLFHQSLKANRIILYIGIEEYQTAEQLPVVLQKQMTRGLDIRFVRDQRSYTKILPALKEFPDVTLITVDDDIFYPLNMIERLVNASRRHPGAICSLVNRTLSLTAKGEIGNYNDFPFNTVSATDVISPVIIPEGFGGVLYPPHSLPSEVFNENLFLHLAPTGDDLWLKAMSLLARTRVVKVQSFFDFEDEFIADEEVQDVGLRNENLVDANNRQLKNLFHHFNLIQYLSD